MTFPDLRRAGLRALFLGLALTWPGQGWAQAPALPDLSRPGWHGAALSYSGYREGQDPDRQIFPTPAQVTEDLRILDRHFRLIRVYGSDRHSADVLEVIRKEGLQLRVMLGIWLSGKPEKQAENRRQIAEGIRLAQAYPELVAAVNVGNEALVHWSDHRMSEAAMIRWVREVRKGVRCKVTVADDYLYWIRPGNRLVRHLDFITLHSYPLWGHLDIDQGLAATVDKYEQVRRRYPGKTIVFGEVGWASLTGPDPRHVPGAGTEVKQKRYVEEITAWARTRGVTTFVFEAFDEPWKGQGTEAHWGLFTVARRPKAVMRDLYPDLAAAPSGAPADGSKP